MRVAVTYDFGVNLGGGDYVILNIMEALGNAGYEISLLTSYPKGLHESAGFFGKPVSNVDIRHVKVPGYLRHPHTIAYITGKATKVRAMPTTLIWSRTTFQNTSPTREAYVTCITLMRRVFQTL